MSSHSTPPDDVAEHLRLWHIPAASNDAMNRIIAHAHEHPRRTFVWVQWLRQIRALMAMPRMRYVVMASVVGVFILVGLVSSPNKVSIKKSGGDILAAITFDEEDPLPTSFWMAGL